MQLTQSFWVVKVFVKQIVDDFLGEQYLLECDCPAFVKRIEIECTFLLKNVVNG